MSNNVAGKPGLDPTLPDVSLVIGGQERHLCFDLNAVCVAEKSTGVNLLKAAVSEVDATSIRGLLFAALLCDDPKITLEEVGTWITMKNIPNVHKAIVTAWFASIDDQEENKDGDTSGEAQAQTTTV